MIRSIETGIAGRGLREDYLPLIQTIGSHLDLQGSVLNKNDGSIKILAEGEEEDLIEFSKELEKARIFSVIENFYVKWFETKELLGNFYNKNLIHR